MPNLDMDKNLQFGLVALQCGLIDMQQFVDACTLWPTRKGHSLADILVQQHWLEHGDREHVEHILRRRVEKEQRGTEQTLAAVPDAVKFALAGIDDPDVRRSLQGIEAPHIAPHAASTAIDGVQLQEKITLRGLHSTGGIGQVWRAYDEILRREIALKELKADTAGSPRNRKRFFREAQLTGQLEHPGIVPVYDFVAHGDGSRCYYTMRFIKGRTLTEAIRAYSEMRTNDPEGHAIEELIRLLNVFISVCQTVAYAHSRGVIHRDLKGDNVILGDFGEVIVLDWGLAKKLDAAPEDIDSDEDELDPSDTGVNPPQAEQPANFTLQGEKLGTPAYMAPEQAAGEVDLIDRRTDVYGLAAILYEILTGEPPFLGKNVIEILHRISYELPRSPTEHNPSVPDNLASICMRGLAKHSDKRQQSASELAEEVQRWIVARAQRKRTEQERERFFNLSLDLLAIVNAQGMLTQTNPAWESVLGWSRSELIGKPVWEVLCCDQRQCVEHDLKRILAGEALTEIETHCLCKDGSRRWILFNASLITGENAVYLVGRDITERKQSEQTFQELLESAPDAMVVVDASGTIVLANTQLQRLFGFTREELLGQPIETLVPEEYRAHHPAHVAGFVANAAFRPMASGLTLNGRRKDGSVFPVEISLSPVKTEQGLLVSCAVRNISQRQSG